MVQRPEENMVCLLTHGAVWKKENLFDFGQPIGELEKEVEPQISLALYTAIMTWMLFTSFNSLESICVKAWKT